VTVAPREMRPQLECAIENLRAISAACGLGPGLAAGATTMRHFKVYLRDAADQSAVASGLQETLLVDGDRVSYIQADICRDALMVEIEATLFGARLAI
jgi:chorismate lyase / 3-hydroxybenzoate synthase